MSITDAAGRSPSYPIMPLPDAINAVRKIEAQYRTAKVDRENAAKLIGYSSLSGPANKALAALAQYGLVERAGKGEMRVTPRARALLYPNDQDEKRDELRAAAFEPLLFRELQERFPDMTPPEDGVATYLNRKGYVVSAIRPAVRAYLQTLLHLEEEGATESHGHGGDGESDPVFNPEPEPADMQTRQPISPVITAAAISPRAFANEAPALNKINMNVRGSQVHLEALLDRAGIAALKRKLDSLEVLLADDEEDANASRPDEEDMDLRD